jgi:glycosyltransferase involved in cell wall biosynthesis
LLKAPNVVDYDRAAMPTAQPAPIEAAAAVELDVSVVIPCLNEAVTIGICVDKAKRALDATHFSYEIVVGDNGSTDGSQAIAQERGARVVAVYDRGYGNAIKGAVTASRGRFLIMGDADDTYDFSAIAPFLGKLERGADLVMGSRFKGGIQPGAMPPLHRYFGNPLLTALLNLFFGAGISDAHCGLRAFTRAAYQKMDPKSGGMEFASEIVIRAAQEHMQIVEVPTTLYPDKRDRPPHLRSFRDGWRHLRFMLMFSPAWLFLLPGVACFLPGVALLFLLAFAEVTINGYTVGLHGSIFAALLTLLGTSILQLGIYAKVLFVGLKIGRDHFGTWFLRSFNFEVFLILGALMCLVGFGADAWVLYNWLRLGGVELPPQVTMRLMLSSTAIIVGAQSMFSSFFLSILRGGFTKVWVD